MSHSHKSSNLKTLHQQLGKKAEDLAASYLQKKGFSIIARNYRHKKAEVDIIAQKKTRLLFVEVKARTSNRFGYPEEFVVPSKQALLREAAENYIIEHDWNQAIRFDIITVLQTDDKVQIVHFEDAFY
ncbi:MAG: YraN family protein [Bacteroidota bacterium]